MPKPSPSGHQTAICGNANYAIWAEYVVLMLIVGLGLILRLQHLGMVTSWFDESFG